MALVLIPYGWGLIVAGVGLTATSAAALLAAHGGGTRTNFALDDPDVPDIPIEEIEREIERIRREQLEPRTAPRDPDEQPEPEPRRDRPLPELTFSEPEPDTEQTIRQRLRRRCYEEDGGCPECPPAEEGTVITHTFGGRTVENPTYRVIGAVYQHDVIPWYRFAATVSSYRREAELLVNQDELMWRRGRSGSWDGLDYVTCTLLETKFGYGKYVDRDVLINSPRSSPVTARPNARDDATLDAAFGSQLDNQVQTILPAREQTSPQQPGLKWIFSNRNVRSVFAIMTQLRTYTWVQDDEHFMPYSTILEEMHEIDMRTSDPAADYGAWGTGG